MRNATSAAQYLPDTDNDIQPLPRQHGHRSSDEAKTIRDNFCSYFSSFAGAVSWQYTAIVIIGN